MKKERLGHAMLPWALAVVFLFLVLFIVLVFWAMTLPKRARQQFLQQRERLLGDFLAAASASGKPRGLRWKSVTWDRAEGANEVVLARDRHTGAILALAPVLIQFEAIAGSDMEGLPAVHNVRMASAVFHYGYRKGAWQTTGKAVFNLGPTEAIAHFKDQYVPLEGE
jgi:hypothetical protein